MTPGLGSPATGQARFLVISAAVSLFLLFLPLAPGVAVAEDRTTQPAAKETSVGSLPGAEILPAPYRIELQGNLGGLAIEVQAGDTGADPFVKLENMDARRATCSVLFKNGPESRTRRRGVDPGQSALLPGGLQRQINVLRITVNCTPG